MTELLHCAKCGGPARLEEGQAWDQDKRKYFKCFRGICLRCGEYAKACHKPSQAEDEWNKMQERKSGS